MCFEGVALPESGESNLNEEGETHPDSIKEIPILSSLYSHPSPTSVLRNPVK